MEEKKKSGLATGLIIGLLIAIIACLTVYIVMDKKNKDSKDNDNKQSSETKKDDKKDNNKDDKTDEVKDLSDVTFDLSNFDYSKVINKDEKIIYVNNVREATNSRLVWGGEGKPNIEIVKVDKSDNDKEVKINIKWDSFVNYNENETKDYSYVVKFNNEVRKAYVGFWGQSMGNESIFYLMKDGTVEYTPITYNDAKDALQNPDSYSLKSHGKIDGVEDVVMIATIQAGPANSTIGGYATTIAIKADGTFYDLREILINTGKYMN